MRARQPSKDAREKERTVAPRRSPHAHVLDLQRLAGNTAVSRLVLARLVQAKLGYEVPRYEYSKGKQEPTKETTGGFVDLAFNPETNVFECTFRINWRSFPKNPEGKDLGWESERGRQVFKERFAAAVKAAWEGKFPLAEHKDGKPTGRSAKVALKFEDVTERAEMTVAEITRRSKLSNAERERLTSRFDFDVSGERVRDSVTVGSLVQMDAWSLTPEDQTTADYKDAAKYGHYKQAKLKLDVGKAGTYQQTAAVHEFGHMIGLADEYVMSKEDYDRAKEGDAKEADRRRAERTKVSGRVMNIGSTITADHYRPFARWLSDLTGGDWRVQG